MTNISLHVLEERKKFPDCPNLLRFGEVTNANNVKVDMAICLAASDAVGRQFEATPLTCNLHCRLHGGPYCGMEQTQDDRDRWIDSIMRIVYGPFVGTQDFYLKIAAKYHAQTVYGMPDREMVSKLRNAMMPTLTLPEVEMICLTGSIIVREPKVRVLKDLDIVVVYNDARKWYTRLRENNDPAIVPRKIAGLVVDYIYSPYPSGWFVSANLFEDELYCSSDAANFQVDSSIKKVVETDNYGHYDYYLKRAFQQFCSEHDIDPKDPQTYIEYQKKMTKRRKEQKRGRLGDMLGKFIKTSTAGTVKECGGCRARKEALNRLA